MSFAVRDLLLTDGRQAQLTEALANLGVDDPLTVLIAEAQAEVTRLIRGYDIDDASVNSWVRVLTLEKAFTAGELGVPEDIAAAAKAAREELQAIAAGKRPNLPLTEAPATPGLGAGNWGSADKVTLRN